MSKDMLIEDSVVETSGTYRIILCDMFLRFAVALFYPEEFEEKWRDSSKREGEGERERERY